MVSHLSYEVVPFSCTQISFNVKIVLVLNPDILGLYTSKTAAVMNEIVIRSDLTLEGRIVYDKEQNGNRNLLTAYANICIIYNNVCIEQYIAVNTSTIIYTYMQSVYAYMHIFTTHMFFDKISHT